MTDARPDPHAETPSADATDGASAALRPRAADPTAWLERHGDRLYAFALARLGRAEDAEDAVQEALIAAWRTHDSFEGRSKESTWLIGILRHKVLDQLRRRAREADWRRELENELVSGQDCWCDAVADADQRKTWQAPERGTAEREELRRELESAIETLPFVMRSAFLLGEIDDVPSRSICEILGITPDHLWTLRHRARVRLRRALDRTLHGAPPVRGGKVTR